MPGAAARPRVTRDPADRAGAPPRTLDAEGIGAFGAGRRLYLHGGPSPMRPGVLAVLRAHGFRPVALPALAEIHAGWGTRPSGMRAARAAARAGRPCLRLEDAFLRSAGLGAWGAPPLGLIADTAGVYYDAGGPSAIERALASDWRLEGAARDRAEAARARFLALELTKYALPRTAPEPPPPGAYAVVVDQTAGDESIARGRASPATFAAMLREALDATEAAGGLVVVRTHPDVLAGAKRGHLGPADIAAMGLPAGHAARVRHHAGGGAMALMAGAARVHVATSLLGFEARLAGTRVEVHGLPHYAGWGEPGDRLDEPRRGVRRTPIEIFALTHLAMPLYLDPHTGRACTFERAMETIAGLRAEAERRAAPTECFGMRGWKHDFVALHLGGGAPGAHPPGHVRHHATLDRAIAAARSRERAAGATPRIGFWAARTSAEDRARIEASGLPFVAIEDGFLRSRGRGAAFTFPGSLALDGRGIYYDPARPSDLEALIEAGGLDPAALERGRRMIEAFRARGLTKYNLAEAAPLPEAPPGRPLVLVLGQVENDASIRAGAIGAVRTNAHLLRAAREAHPRAFLVYRPHPDVARGRRPGEVPRPVLERLANAVAPRAPLPALMRAAERVHVITSLGGLEALMHGTPVACHGAPFYAGWGLTEDAVPLPRRTRRASLEEVVAAAHILYPSFVDPVTRLFCPPERLIERIEAGGGYRVWGVPFTLGRRWLDALARYARR